MKKARINISNYEEVFLDYFEGRLDAVEEKELLSFLEIYPQLRAEFESFSPVRIPKEELEFPGKELLKKQPALFDDTLIAFMEGDLAAGDIGPLRKLIAADPLLNEELRLLRLTKLEPDMSVRFPLKNRLKKQGAVRYLYYSAAAAAACLAMIFLFSRAPELPSSPGISHRNTTRASGSVPQPVAAAPLEEAPAKILHRVKGSGLLRTDLAPAPEKSLALLERKETPGYPVPAEEPPLAVRAPEKEEPEGDQYLTLLQAAKNLAKDKITRAGENAPILNEAIEKKRLPEFSRIAEQGLKGLAKLTGADISMKKTVDSTSSLAQLTIDIGSFQLSRTYTAR
jgi:hypothetical protein